MSVELDTLYIAYRKAKQEAFYDRNCAHGVKFAKYENDLEKNLRILRRRLSSSKHSWANDASFIGTHTYIPKSVSVSTPESSGIRFFDSDAVRDWKRVTNEELAEVKLRPVIDATVDYLVSTAYWSLTVGDLLDRRFNNDCVYGNRLHRHASRDGVTGEINRRAFSLFYPYVAKYGSWRNDGLRAIRSELERGNDVVTLTMDVEQFYHRIDPNFILDDRFIELVSLELDQDQEQLTTALLKSFSTWRSGLPLRSERASGLPVGLPASSIIANALFVGFDDAMLKLMPVFYGRYVDDLFIVLHPRHDLGSPAQLATWLAKSLSRASDLVQIEASEDGSLDLRLEYAPESHFQFRGSKQRAFKLSASTGLDLLVPIEETIRSLSSEYRLLPVLPSSEAEMSASALVASSDAKLEADALRHADAVTIRRAGFRLLLNKFRAHARDLPASAWSTRRGSFYGLFVRQILTPRGLFEYTNYLPEIFGTMCALGDFEQIDIAAKQLSNAIAALRSGVSMNRVKRRFSACWTNVGNRIVEALEAACPRGREKQTTRGILRVQTAVGAPSVRSTEDTVRNHRLLRRLGWNLVVEPPGAEPLQTEHAILHDLPRDFNADVIRRFLPQDDLRRLVFSVRRCSMMETTRSVTARGVPIRNVPNVVNAIRGTWYPRRFFPRAAESTGLFRRSLSGPDKSTRRIAIVSIETSDEDFRRAVLGRPNLTLDRYSRMMRLVNDIIRQRDGIDYVTFPECSLPRQWAYEIAARLASAGVSLIAGLEHDASGMEVRNEALISLVHREGRRRRSGHVAFCFEQPKMHPAWSEASDIERLTGKKAFGASPSDGRVVYTHGDFMFAVLICSDFSSIQNRQALQGIVDAVFVPEWNRDVATFNALVESSAHDLHCYIIQCNNRKYGDSRIRAPMREDFRRDLVRLKGGVQDFFVVADIDVVGLRKFHTATTPDMESRDFKPFPVGFVSDPSRRDPQPRRGNDQPLPGRGKPSRRGRHQ